MAQEKETRYRHGCQSCFRFLHLSSLHAILRQKPFGLDVRGAFLFCIFALDKLAIMKKVFALFLTLIAAFSFSACNKTEPQHDTTYVWGKNNWSAVQPLDQKVPSSADSASVRYVYLLNDGNSWTGTPASWILRNLNRIIELVALENRHKIRGSGTLNDVGILQDKDVLDSITLSKMGFQFGMVHYGNYDRSSYGK